MLLSLLNFTDLNGIPFQKKRSFTCKCTITGIGKYSKKKKIEQLSGINSGRNS